MTPGRWLLLTAFGLIVALEIILAPGASGYILPAEQLLEFVAENTSRVYNFRLDALIENPEPVAAGVTLRRRAVFYAARPDYLRKEVLGTETGTVLVGSGKRFSIIDGQVLEEAARHEEIFPVLLLADSAETLAALLKAEGVDTTRVRLDRLGNEVAYVIGGASAQFWCTKDGFRPLRLLGRRSRSGVADTVDIRFLDFREVEAHIWMPSVIEFYRENKLCRRILVQQVQVNQHLPEQLFDLEAFAARYPLLPPPSMPPEEPAQAFEERQRYLEKKYQ